MVTLNIDLNKLGTQEVSYKIKSNRWHEIWVNRGNKQVCTVLHLEDERNTISFFNEILQTVIDTVHHTAIRGEPFIVSYRLTAYKSKSRNTLEVPIDSRELGAPPVRASTDYSEVQKREQDFHRGNQEVNSAPVDFRKEKLSIDRGVQRQVKSENDVELKHPGFECSLPAPLPPDELKKELLATQIDLIGNDSIYEEMMLPKSPEEVVKQIGDLLTTAINSGDKENAEKFAAELALRGAKVTITVDTSSIKKDLKDAEFSIKVYVEDREASGGCINLKVKATDTVLDLKNKMFMKHSFPVEVQKWIIGKRMPPDTETLQRAKVTPGQSVFLYLVSARSVGLNKEEVMGRKEQMVYAQGQPGNFVMQGNDSGDYMRMVPKTPSTPQSANLKSTPSPGLRPIQPNPQASPTPQVGQQTRENRGAQGRPPPQGDAKRRTGMRKDSGSQQSFEFLDLPAEFRQDPLSNQTAAIGGAKLDAISNQMTVSTGAREEPEQIGWQCPDCTYINKPTWPGCEICSKDRPASYKVPDNYRMTKEEEDRLKREQESEQRAQKLERERLEKRAQKSKENFRKLLAIEEQNLVPNTEEFDCPICFDRIQPNEGVILRECLHSFCRECLKGAVQHNDDANIRCPFQDDIYSCSASLQEREVKALVPQDVFEKYLQRSLSTAESQERNSFHCKTADCLGWCIYEDNINFFECPICGKKNCLTCKAIHEGMNCKQYQEDLKVRAANDAAARQTQQMLTELVKKGDAMNCPQCDVILQKKDGCDWIKCSICKTEICWVTKGPRWGPLGPGDISGGCLCRVNGRKCHEECNNCH